jgi:hypothetical protein
MLHGMTRDIHGKTQLLNLLKIINHGGDLTKTETARDGEATMKVASIDAETEEALPPIAEVATSEEPSASSETIKWLALLPSSLL